MCLNVCIFATNTTFCPLQLHWKGTFYITFLTLGTREIVQYSYRAEEDDEIDLVIGDIVLVFGKSGDGWCKGAIGGRKGWFPRNFTIERMYDCCTVISH